MKSLQSKSRRRKHCYSAMMFPMTPTRNHEQTITCCSINDYMFNYSTIESGVPQGSVIVHLLSLIYIKDIERNIKSILRFLLMTQFFFNSKIYTCIFHAKMDLHPKFVLEQTKIFRSKTKKMPKNSKTFMKILQLIY